MNHHLFARLNFLAIATWPIVKNAGRVKMDPKEIEMKQINYSWRSSFNRKVHQRAVNAVVRAINENVKNDDLWQGRFFIRQYNAQVASYGDGSGMELFIQLRLYDHKTKKYKPIWVRSNEIITWGGYKVWEAMNTFIVEDIDVWRNESPRVGKTDWRKVSKEKTIQEAACIWDK